MGLERRFAIIVGSNAYDKDHQLQFSLKDADDITNILQKRCDFQKEDIITIKIENTFKEDVEIQLCEAFNSIKNKGFIRNLHTILFYYSGHGNSIDDVSYLEVSNNEKIPLPFISKAIKNLNGKNNYMIIDACNSGNPINFETMHTAKTSKLARQLSYNSNSQEIYCLFSSLASQKSYEPNLSQSAKIDITNAYLTHYFIEVIKNPERYVEGVLGFSTIQDYVKIKLQAKTQLKQTPVSQMSIVEGMHPFAIWKEVSTIVQATPEKISLTVISKNTNWILFTNYTQDCEPYYQVRTADINFLQYLEVTNIWMHGKSGSGKTALIFRNLHDKRDYLYCDLSPITIHQVDDILEEVIETICDRYGFNNNSLNNPNKIKYIVALLKLCAFKSNILIVIDELSLKDDIRIAFAEAIVNLVVYCNHQCNNGYLKFVISTIASPHTILPNKSKAIDYFNFLSTDDWSNELESLFDTLDRALNLKINRQNKILILSSIQNSPRLMKNIFKQLSLSKDVSDDNIRSSIAKTLNEAV